jgi:hypothetical protein
MPGPKENVIERALVARVRQLGGVADKVQVIGRRGFCDRLIVLPGGRVIFVECKRPRGGRLSPHQVHYREIYAACGVTIELVHTIADIDRLLG